MKKLNSFKPFSFFQELECEEAGEVLEQGLCPGAGVLLATGAGVEALASSPHSAANVNRQRRNKSVAEGDESSKCAEAQVLKWQKSSP